MSNKEWEGDWVGRLEKRIRLRGFADAESFSEAFPTATYDELAKRLGDDVAPIQVEQVLRSLFIQKGRFDRFARSCLIRYLHEFLPEGWTETERFELRVAQAFGTWSGALGEEYDNQTDAVWDNLEEAAIPKGWLPSGPDDKWVNEAFSGVEF